MKISKDIIYKSEVNVPSINQVSINEDFLLVKFSDGTRNYIPLKNIPEFENVSIDIMKRFKYSKYTLYWRDLDFDLSNKHLFYSNLYLTEKAK
jgi:hypothetical protein